MSEPRGQARAREAPGRGDLRELAWVFLKLGTLGFGGPAAHIALMKHEVVERRAWLSPGEFLDLLAATQLIPGPNSTEMAIHVGHRRAGAAGLVVAGASFILPATLIVTAMAWCYVRFGAYPQAGSALFAIKPVIIAIVVQALWSMGHTAIRSLDLAIIGCVAKARPRQTTNGTNTRPEPSAAAASALGPSHPIMITSVACMAICASCEPASGNASVKVARSSLRHG